MTPELEELVTQICTKHWWQAIEADLVMVACARTLAAFYGRKE